MTATLVDAYGFRPFWRGRLHLIAAVLAAPAVLRHRLLLTPEAQVGARTTDQIVRDVLNSTEVPR